MRNKTMATVQVNDPFFDITLTSDGFEDDFPNNTVSNFKARMPSKLVLQRPYKVALHKLSFTNAINNIGNKINTRLLFTKDDSGPVEEIHFPETSIDDASEFVQLLHTQFEKYEKYIRLRGERVKRSAPTYNQFSDERIELYEYFENVREAMLNLVLVLADPFYGKNGWEKLVHWREQFVENFGKGEEFKKNVTRWRENGWGEIPFEYLKFVFKKLDMFHKDVYTDLKKFKHVVSYDQQLEKEDFFYRIKRNEKHNFLWGTFRFGSLEKMKELFDPLVEEIISNGESEKKFISEHVEASDMNVAAEVVKVVEDNGDESSELWTEAQQMKKSL
ncbi:MAG: hypothetical protein H7836_17695, partial [Magnetococcus sp. YQC-3]